MESTEKKTRQLTVNAAFLKDIKDDNHDLKTILDRITPLAQHKQIAANHWPELSGLWGDLRDQLALHFSLEEAYGYFDDAITHAPQLTASAESLRSDHAKLFERIRALADKAAEIPGDAVEKIGRVLEDYEAFRADFARHEEGELKLILDALDDDLGVGD